jgi:hypothetical protein
MQSFFWHVLSNENIYNSLIAEIKAAVADGSVPTKGNLSWNEAQALQYFQSCLKEAMRVRPAVGLNITRLVPPEGSELDGHFFPGGTSIAVNGWVLHRDQDVFGLDAEDFRPERWLEDAEKAKRMERYMFQVSQLSILFVPYITDSRYSLAEEVISALAVTWPCLRLTRLYLDFFETIDSDLYIQESPLKLMRPSLWSRRVWRFMSRRLLQPEPEMKGDIYLGLLPFHKSSPVRRRTRD